MAQQMVTKSQKIIDTLALGLTVLITGLVWSGTLLRWLVGLWMIMAVLELVVGLIRKGSNYTSNKVFFIVPEVAVLLAASLSTYNMQITSRQLIAIVIATTSTDACGLFMGTVFRKSKLGRKVPFLKNISPNKTYVGYLGELFGGALAFLTLAWFLRIGRTLLTVCFAFILPVASAIGDLLGSVSKRALGTKDSCEFIADLPLIGWLEWFTKSRSGYLDTVDSISASLALFSLLSLFL